MNEYIQIGVTALRDPVTGEPLPAVPLYVRARDMGVKDEAEATAPMMADAGRALAGLMKQYVNGCRKAGLPL